MKAVALTVMLPVLAITGVKVMAPSEPGAKTVTVESERMAE